MDTTRGIYRSIGVPEIGKFLKAENVGDAKKEMLRNAIQETKDNTCNRMDTTRGIYRSIGVPEIGKFLKAENVGDAEKEMLTNPIQETKDNTCKLVVRQVEKIQRLKEKRGWDIRRVDSITVFKHYGEECCRAYWEKLVLKPSLEIVADFPNMS